MTNISDLDLFNKLLNNDTENEVLNENEICMISNLPLEKNYIQLNCGHKFNYLSLYEEIVYQKTKKLADNYCLRLNEIKCPYCRNISNKLLPFYKYYSISQIKGVNYPPNLCMKINECEHINKTTKERCNMNGCITKLGCFCNKHFKYNKEEEDLLNNIDNDFYTKYKKKNIYELKEELRKYKLKLGGTKDELIKRLYIQHKYLDSLAGEIQNTASKYLNKKYYIKKE
jgi:hypothetical protein